MKIRAKHRMIGDEPASPETRREFHYKVEQRNLDGSLTNMPYTVTEDGIDVPKPVAEIFMKLWGDRIEVVPDEPGPVVEAAEEISEAVAEEPEPAVPAKRKAFKRKRK